MRIVTHCQLNVFYVYFKYMFAAQLFFFHPVPVLESVLFYYKETFNGDGPTDIMIIYIMISTSDCKRCEPPPLPLLVGVFHILITDISKFFDNIDEAILENIDN